MKTVKINQRFNTLVFLLFLLLVLIVLVCTSASAQTIDKDPFTSQTFGDSSLVQMDVESWGDSLLIEYTADEELAEVVDVRYINGKYVKGSSHSLEIGSKHSVVITNNDIVFFRSDRGVTSVQFAFHKGRGFVLVNGKVMAESDNDENFVDASIPSTFFKNKIAWSYNDKKFR